MQWKIAEAKQRLSELIRASAQAPQLIYNRDVPVAVVIAAEELPEYEAWKRSRIEKPTLAQEFTRLRHAAAGHPDPLPDVDRSSLMRANPFEPVAKRGSKRRAADADGDATR